MKIKYPRTYHLPWSRSYTDDDRVLMDTEHYIGKQVVVTEKLDGENTSLYRHTLHARSRDSKDHPSRHWVKGLHGMIQSQIPEGWRLCGENVYAMHSIYYEALPSYFLLFSAWNEHNLCLSWDDTEELAERLGLVTVPVLYRGVWDQKKIHELYTVKSRYGGVQEGYVVRLADAFPYEQFKHAVAKFVRVNHVQTSEHWLSRPIVPNRIQL